MTIRVRSPLADINAAPAGKPVRTLAALEGGRMGLLWSQHASSVKFWPVFEEIAAARFRPADVRRLYKSSTWNVAPAEDVRTLAGQVDYVFVGVGG